MIKDDPIRQDRALSPSILCLVPPFSYVTPSRGGCSWNLRWAARRMEWHFQRVILPVLSQKEQWKQPCVEHINSEPPPLLWVPSCFLQQEGVLLGGGKDQTGAPLPGGGKGVGGRPQPVSAVGPG